MTDERTSITDNNSSFYSADKGALTGSFGSGSTGVARRILHGLTFLSVAIAGGCAIYASVVAKSASFFLTFLTVLIWLFIHIVLLVFANRDQHDFHPPAWFIFVSSGQIFIQSLVILFSMESVLAYTNFLFSFQNHSQDFRYEKIDLKIFLSPLQNEPSRYAIHFDYQSKLSLSTQPSALIINRTNSNQSIQIIIYNNLFPKNFCSFQLFHIDFHQYSIQYHNLSCYLNFEKKFIPLNSNSYIRTKSIDREKSSENFFLFLLFISLSTITPLIILIRTYFYFNFLSETFN